MSEKWNNPVLQKIADESEARLRKEDALRQVAVVIAKMDAVIADPCLDRTNEEYAPISWVKEWRDELAAIVKVRP